MHLIIGAGGVGSWLTPSLCMLLEPEDITVCDGDKLEKKNLNRQLFTNEDIGQFKADALAKKYGCKSIPQWYSHGAVELGKQDWILCCVDNNPARKAALESADAYGCKVIFAANEVTSAEAYYYEPKFKDTPLDPRKYYPGILTDESDDPRHAAIGCTGEAQRNNRQLVTANFMAAALLQHLFVLWKLERPKMDREAVSYLPARIRQNMTKTETFRVKD